MADLKTVITSTQLAPALIQGRQKGIYEQLLRTSRHVCEGNFRSIHPADLRWLFETYDGVFFEGTIARSLGTTPLHFRLSRRMTSAGGTTTRRRRRRPLQSPTIEFEIAISTTLLFQTFRDVDRGVTTAGIPCRDRVEALQRLFEHELIHLVELLVWSDSSCSESRFQTIASSLFGHREHTHQLITQRERAYSKFGLKLGDHVTFRMDGKSYNGVINRITRRATVLVEDQDGVRYTNGKRYRKFYIPIDMLQAATCKPSNRD